MTRPLGSMILLAALLAPLPALALDLEPRFGVGYQSTLGGAQGLSARYQASATIGLELIAGFEQILPDSDEVGAVDVLYFAGGFSFVLASDERGLISLGTRVNVGTGTFERRVEERLHLDRVTDIAFEVPLSIEYFVTPHFSLRVGVGLVFAIINSEGRVLLGNDTFDPQDRTGGSSLSLGVGEVLGNAGFTLWL